MRIVVLFCSITLLSTNVVAVCNQPQPRLVCAEFFASEIVVEAKLAASNYIAPASDMDGHLYEMQTEKVLSGKMGSSFQVWEENSSGRATFDWTVGSSYLLFLHSRSDRGWLLDGCGNSGKQSALEEIEALQNRSGGMIQVALGGDVFAWSPAITGVEVSAQGMHGTFSAKTNARGVAEIHVPAGRYSVTVPGQRVQPFDFTYDRPGKVLIENGSCAQVQFVNSANKQ